MSATEVKITSIQILERVLGAPCSANDPAAELISLAGWDSLKHMQLILEIEGLLDAALDTDEIEALITLGDLDRLFVEKNLG
jgi:acyl carrier protein